MIMRACQVTIEGRVQGVGFRDSLRHEAMRAAVRGWVRNRRNGSVEALLVGSDTAVAALLEWCRHGPPSATVSRVQVAELDVAACPTNDTFEFQPTC